MQQTPSPAIFQVTKKFATNPPVIYYMCIMGDNTKMKYSDEMATKICELIISGKPIREICAPKDMPDATTMFKWMYHHDEFAIQYVKAKEIQAEVMVQEMLDIADNGTNDYVTKENKDGSSYRALDSEHVQRSRLRVDTRKWAASKFKPKIFGESTQLKHANHEGDELKGLEVVYVGAKKNG